MLIRVKLPTEDKKRISGFGDSLFLLNSALGVLCARSECEVISEGSLCDKTKAPTHRKVSGR